MITATSRLDRSIVIHARPATVFEFFTNDRDWASWWGAGSAIDARRGGQLLIRHPNGVEMIGEVLELQPPDRIVFTYGYSSGKPIPAGGSQVTIRLAAHPGGTLLQLTHEFSDVEARDHHVQGWRYQLSLFANAVANKVNASAAETVDRWFAAWSDPQAASREATLSAAGTDDIRFYDRFSCIAGAGERPHVKRDAAFDQVGLDACAPVASGEPLGKARCRLHVARMNHRIGVQKQGVAL